MPLAIVITAMSGLVSLAVQQNFRQNANDPQIQLAEDTASALGTGKAAAGLISANSIDISQTLAPFVIVYDANEKPLTPQVTLNGQTPTPPNGVFDSAKESGENRLTWQPAAGVRIAAVVVPIAEDKGYILAGRNLREVEKRESQLNLEVFVAWAAAMILTLLWAIWDGIYLAGLPKTQ